MENSNIPEVIPILLIDDDPNILDGIARVIEDAFPGVFQISRAYDGHQAVIQLEKNYYPIIISDIMMPYMDGLQLLELLHSNGIPSRVIMLSGYDDYAFVRRSMKMGAYDYLLKPVNIQTVTELLTNLRSSLVKSHAKLPEDCVHMVPDLPKKESYFDIPCEKPLSVEELRDGLTQINSLLFCNELEEMEQQLRRLFAGLSPEVLSVSQWKGILSNFLYDTMQKNEIMIRIVARYKLTENDFSAQVKNQPTASQLMVKLIEIMKTYADDLVVHQKVKEDVIVKHAQEFIQTHYAQNLNLADIAQQSFLHPNYFSALFKKKTGVTIREYILQVRVGKAKELMENPELKLQEIAAAVGYEDQAHFNRAFKNVTGMAPSQYRKQN